MDRVDGVVDVSVAVLVAIDGVLLPDLGHELREARRSRGAHGPRIPAALGGKLRRQDLGRHHGAALRSLDDHGTELLGHDDGALAEQVGTA